MIAARSIPRFGSGFGSGSHHSSGFGSGSHHSSGFGTHHSSGFGSGMGTHTTFQPARAPQEWVYDVDWSVVMSADEVWGKGSPGKPPFQFSGWKITVVEPKI